jgi:hypothetical protein
LKINGNKPIPTNIVKMKDKAMIILREKKEEQSDEDANAVISEQETNSQGSELRRSARES